VPKLLFAEIVAPGEDNMKDNINHPKMKYPTNLVGPTSSGSCHVKDYTVVIIVKLRERERERDHNLWTTLHNYYREMGFNVSLRQIG